MYISYKMHAYKFLEIALLASILGVAVATYMKVNKNSSDSDK